jgi:hypothetical protein
MRRDDGKGLRFPGAGSGMPPMNPDSSIEVKDLTNPAIAIRHDLLRYRRIFFVHEPQFYSLQKCACCLASHAFLRLPPKFNGEFGMNSC